MGNYISNLLALSCCDGFDGTVQRWYYYTSTLPDLNCNFCATKKSWNLTGGLPQVSLLPRPSRICLQASSYAHLQMRSLIALVLFPLSILAATKTYDFNVTWTTANPDGLFHRRTIGINGQWPIPTIEVNKGDRLIVNMYNGLGDQNTSLHFHGIFQNGTTAMDGAAGVTQCPVGPGQKITYDFIVSISLLPVVIGFFFGASGY